MQETGMPDDGEEAEDEGSGDTAMGSDDDGDGSTSDGADTDGDSGSGSSDDATTGEELDIPDPGGRIVICEDVEPNDEPNDAVPCGLVTPDFDDNGALYMFGGTIGDGDDYDYFVFHTSAEIGALHQFAEWFGTTGNLLDFRIYEVTGGGTGIEEVFASTTTDPNQEFPTEDIVVSPDTDYLLEVISVEGSGEYGL